MALWSPSAVRHQNIRKRDEVADLAIYISGGTALAVVGYAVKITWQMSRVEKDVRAEAVKGDKELGESMEAQIDNLQRDIVRFHRSGMEKSDVIIREFGETAAAIRQKLHDVEVFSRDHFVSKDSFESVVGRIERSFEKMTDRLEEKLEKAVERFHPRD
jgi:aminoglycoside phosphotransferase family enzyme